MIKLLLLAVISWLDSIPIIGTILAVPLYLAPPILPFIILPKLLNTAIINTASMQHAQEEWDMFAAEVAWNHLKSQIHSIKHGRGLDVDSRLMRKDFVEDVSILYQDRIQECWNT